MYMQREVMVEVGSCVCFRACVKWVGWAALYCSFMQPKRRSVGDMVHVMYVIGTENGGRIR